MHRHTHSCIITVHTLPIEAKRTGYVRVLGMQDRMHRVRREYALRLWHFAEGGLLDWIFYSWLGFAKLSEVT